MTPKTSAPIQQSPPLSFQERAFVYVHQKGLVFDDCSCNVVSVIELKAKDVDTRWHIRQVE